MPDDIPQTFFRSVDTTATRARSADAVGSTSRMSAAPPPTADTAQCETEAQARVPPSRRRGTLAATRAGHQLIERSFFCRTCQMSERGLWVPAGWYTLARAVGGAGRHLKLGLYCSLACLMEAAGDLAQGAADHAGRLGLESEDDHARQRDRILETAQTLLHGGMTIRQAAESLGMPTGALRTWLHAAGIRVGAKGTLDDPPTTPKPGSIASTRSPGASPSTSHASASNPQPDPAGKHPVSMLNELALAGRISDLTWKTTSTGSSHEPLFTVTITATVTTEPPVGNNTGSLTAQGSASTKQAAKRMAAAELLTKLS